MSQVSANAYGRADEQSSLPVFGGVVLEVLAQVSLGGGGVDPLEGPRNLLLEQAAQLLSPLLHRATGGGQDRSRRACADLAPVLGRLLDEAGPLWLDRVDTGDALAEACSLLGGGRLHEEANRNPAALGLNALRNSLANP